MASVLQKCKTTEPPCNQTRCGHTWTVRYREPGGRTARQREKSFKRKREADAFATKIEGSKNEGLYLDPDRGQITVRAWAEEWISALVINETTRRNYRGLLDNWVIPNLGRKTLAGVSQRDVQRLVTTMRNGGLAASTVRDRLNPIRNMFEAAVRDRRIAENPCNGVSLPRTASARVDPDEIPNLTDVQTIADAISPQYRLTVWLMAGTGLRISEALAVSEDCHRDDFLRVRQQVSSKANRGDSATKLVPLKHRAEGEYRDVPLPSVLSKLITDHIEQWGTKPVDGVDVLFAPRERGKGTMPTATTYTYHWRKALRACGLVTGEKRDPMYTPHSLRHFFASTALVLQRDFGMIMG